MSSPAAAAPVVAEAVAADAPVVPELHERERNVFADMPFLSLGMIVALMLIFGLERRLAFDIDKTGSLTLESLIALGATSYDSVFGAGEIWRVFLAPLLHASNSHIIGNAVAMFFASFRLEPLVGRAWYAGIFAISALGGVIGSLLGNDPGLSSVGASGAITGLIGALFIVSFSPQADPYEQHTMRKTALFFGIPALLPLMWGASGSTDYFCHLGGAIAGAGLALAYCLTASTDNESRVAERPLTHASLAALGCSVIACIFVFTGYSAHAARAAFLIPAAEVPNNLSTTYARSTQLLARYPKDPRSHLIRAITLADAGQYPSAEATFRSVLSMTSLEPRERPVRKMAQMGLAVVVAEQGRRAEARELAAEMCRAKKSDPSRVFAEKAKLCR